MALSYCNSTDWVGFSAMGHWGWVRVANAVTSYPWCRGLLLLGPRVTAECDVIFRSIPLVAVCMSFLPSGLPWICFYTFIRSCVNVISVPVLNRSLTDSVAQRGWLERMNSRYH
jgi:hypothetical protein